jgi:TRAP-type C4-dicarboxylate transport system permease large subunit
MIRMNDRAPVAASIDPLFVAGGVGGLVMCLGVVGALYVARRSSAEEEAEPR